MPPSVPKCKVRKTWPTIGPKECKAKPEEPKGSKSAPAQAPVVRDTPLIRRQRHATRNLQPIRDENHGYLTIEPVWIALWNTLGQAIEIVKDEQSGEVTSPASTPKGCGIPSIIAPGQKERVMMWLMGRTLPDKDHEIVPSARVREGVSLAVV
jgi:hypothetical protein